MSEDERAAFYAHYQAFKDYRSPQLKPKHVGQFDREFWNLSACAPAMSVLEIGCGTGLFLAYLDHKGVGDFLGIDRDPALAQHIPPAVAGKFEPADILAFIDSGGGGGGRRFDRVALFDVLEHFTAAEGLRLLTGIKKILRPGGKAVIRVPNASSPWGLQYQFGDLTHRTAFTPESLRQLAQAAGYECRCFPQSPGRAFRRWRERMFNWLAGYFVASPPEIWSANFIAVIETK